MNFFNGKKRVKGSFLAGLVVFFGTLASPALADDTVAVNVSLESWRCYDPGAGFSITIGDGFTLDAISEGSSMDLITATGSCLLEKGASYDLEVWGLGPYYTGADGYNALVAENGIIVKDDKNILGDHSSDYWEFAGPFKVWGATATIHVPKITYKTYMFDPPLFSWSPSYTTVILKCEPAGCLSDVDVAIEWSAKKWDGTPVSVTPLGRLHCKVEVPAPVESNPFPFVVLTAKYAEGTVYGGIIQFNGGNGPMEITDLIVAEENATTEPIDTKSGNNYFTETRLFAPAPGVPLALDLFYKSVSDLPSGRLGKGWRHSYEWELFAPSNSAALLLTGSGEKLAFEQQTNGIYSTPAANNWKLEAVAGGYEVELPGGTTYSFGTNGALLAISDAWGNGMECSYGTNGCLETVLHTNGRQIFFNNQYDSVLGDWRVATIQMQNGASLGFSYNTNGQFTQIIEQVGSINYSNCKYGFPEASSDRLKAELRTFRPFIQVRSSGFIRSAPIFTIAASNAAIVNMGVGILGFRIFFDFNLDWI